MASPALSTLRHVTERKLGKLAHHRSKFETDKKAILANVASAPTHLEKLEVLLKGFERHGITPKQADLSLSNLERFVHQARRDSSVSGLLLRGWQSKLEHELDVVSVKYEYAALFGKLVMDWINNPNTASTTLIDSPASGGSDTAMGESFDRVGRKEMREQRKEWESYVFTKKQVDESRIQAYLNEIFGTTLQAQKIKKSPLQNLRDSMKNVMDFRSDLQTPKQKDEFHGNSNVIRGEHENRFTVKKLKSCILGILHSDLLAGSKRKALADLQNQPAVLTELADVLNMDLDALDEWEWDPVPVPLHMRRQLNSKYRVYMDEEVHQAILLYFIGKTWAVALKKAFTAFYQSGAWLQTPHRSMSRKARARREYFVPNSTTISSSVRNSRREAYQGTYFMTQLPENDLLDDRSYDGEEQGERHASSTRSHLATKQSMLRLVTAEMLLNTKIYGEFLVIQSDFKSFGPSLPHDTIFAVLKFFGVPGKWLRFFKKFLEAPVAFAQDGLEAQVHTRACGIPMSHALSDALSEAVLFCLDFAVNKRTQGANIYRFHDDLWFWGQESSCIQAWNALQEFSGVMGLALNEKKTGAALVVADEAKARPLPPALPQGKIKWGFLNLDAVAGRWVVDRTQVDEHIEELRHQLGACRSVMAWVQAWNAYVSQFFGTNLGQPANCFGRQHNDLIIATYEHIQRGLFADAGAANVTDYLRTMLKERFNTKDPVPDGFFYFPVELGGLGLRNPLITAFSTYRLSYSNAGEPIDRAFDEEQEAYERSKEAWESGNHRPKRAKHAAKESDIDLEGDEPFMTFEEFTRYREEVSAPLQNAYTVLMQTTSEEWIDTPGAVSSALYENSLEDTAEKMSYWRWICNLYAGDIKQRFGGEGTQLGERSLLPVGLLDVLKSEKVRWEG